MPKCKTENLVLKTGKNLKYLPFSDAEKAKKDILNISLK